MKEEESRCPRCSDYDKVKEELESSKRNSEREVKDSLKKCESKNKKLQKQLLTIGAIAIVAGTILGKDFVDMVGDYINSFNKVKDGASSLIGMVDAPENITSEEIVQSTQQEEDEQEQEEEPKIAYSPPTAGYFIPIFDDNVFGSLYPSTSIVDLKSILPDTLKDFNNFTQEDPYDLIYMPSMLDEFLSTNSIAGGMYETSVFNTPSNYTEQTPFAVVPTPGTLGLLGVAFTAISPRRR